MQPLRSATVLRAMRLLLGLVLAGILSAAGAVFKLDPSPTRRARLTRRAENLKPNVIVVLADDSNIEIKVLVSYRFRGQR